MPSESIQDSLTFLRDRQKAGAQRAPATVEEARAAFARGHEVDPVTGRDGAG